MKLLRFHTEVGGPYAILAEFHKNFPVVCSTSHGALHYTILWLFPPKTNTQKMVEEFQKKRLNPIFHPKWEVRESMVTQYGS